VAGSSIPVLEELGLKRDWDAEVLSNSAEKISGDPHGITDLLTNSWSNLILPHAGHDFSVSSRNLDSSEEASLVVSIHDSSTVANVGTNWAVVGSLRAWEARWRPSEGLNSELVLDFKKRVLLLDTEPGLLEHTSIKDRLGIVAEVGISRLKSGELLVCPHEGLGHDDDVVATSERIGEISHRLHDNFWVVGWGLIAWGAIVVPVGEVSKGVNLVGDGLSLWSKRETTSVDPNVFGDGWASLLKVVVTVVSEKLFSIHLLILRLFKLLILKISLFLY